MLAFRFEREQVDAGPLVRLTYLSDFRIIGKRDLDVDNPRIG